MNSDEDTVKEKIKKFENSISSLKTEKKKNDTSVHPTLSSADAIETIKQRGSLYYQREEDTITSANINSLSIKECWICLSLDESEFVRPCLCKGSTKYVHKKCFLKYLENKSLKNLKCSFCKKKYMLKAEEIPFIPSYELLRRLNALFSNFVFIVVILTLVYSILFIYGFSVLLAFVGKKYLLAYLRESNMLNLYFAEIPFNFIRLGYICPVLPVILLMTRQRKFSLVFNLVPSILLVDTFSFKWLLLYFLPVIAFFYNRAIMNYQYRLGMVYHETGSVIINNHFVELKILVNTLTGPFWGVLIGRVLFFFSSMENHKKSIIGYMIAVFFKDLLCIRYLQALQNRNKNVEIGEYLDN